MGSNPRQTFKRKLIATSVAAVMVGISQSATVYAAEVEEVIVTATKRATSLQDTPLAISAFSQDTLTENSVVNVTDLRGVVPSVQFRESGDHNIPLISIRGLGTADVTEAGDSGVAFYADGIFAARAQGTTVMMYDVAGVEILRGPQGTLFGRNSTAGAVSINTAKPTTEGFKASGEMSFGSNNAEGRRAMINVPLSDTFAVRIAGATERAQGTTQYTPGNQFDGSRTYGTKDLSSHRISTLFTPNDDISWFLSYEEFVNQGTGDVPSLDFKHRSNNATSVGNVDLDSKNLRTRFDWTFGPDLTFSYIGGKSKFDQSQIYGNEFQGDIRNTRWSTYDATQNEIQLKNGDDSSFRWVAGLFNFSESNGIRFDMYHGSWGFPEGPGTPTGQQPETSAFIQPDRGLDSKSAYVSGTYDIMDNFRVNAGIRYTEDTRSDVGGRSIDCTYDLRFTPVDAFNTVLNPVARQTLLPVGKEACWVRQYNDMEKKWDKVTYKLGFDYDISDDVMVFTSYTTGWKSGVLADGLDSSATGGKPDPVGNLANIQDPEQVNSFELGVKSSLFDNSVTFNSNLFYMSYTDMQVTAAVINPTTQESTLKKTNAGESTIQGIEAEWTWAASENGTFNGNFTILDAKYDEFIGSDGVFGNKTGEQWNPCVLGYDGGGNCKGFDLAGNKLPNAPDFSFTIGYKHNINLADNLVLTPRVNFSYFGDMYLGSENRGDRAPKTLDAKDPGAKDFDVQAAYGKVDIAVALAEAEGKWHTEVFVNNATDEAIKQEVFGLNSGAGTGYKPAYGWAAGRTAGVRVSFDLE